jgi:hypothetical protein
MVVEIISTIPVRYRLRLIKAIVRFQLDHPDSQRKLPALSVNDCACLIRVVSAFSVARGTHSKNVVPNEDPIMEDNVNATEVDVGNNNVDKTVKELQALLVVMMGEAVQRGKFH